MHPEMKRSFELVYVIEISMLSSSLSRTIIRY